jgi:hypothetical protein
MGPLRSRTRASVVPRRLAGHVPGRRLDPAPAPASHVATRSNVTAAVMALVGVVIGGAFTLIASERAADSAVQAEERQVRRAAYTEYRIALDDYARAAALRKELCVPASDRPLAEGGLCEPHLDEYQRLRSVLQDEMSDMQLVASEEALGLVTMFGGLLPRASGGLTGNPEDREIPTDLYRQLHSMFLDVSGCDTALTLPDDCDMTRLETAALWDETGHMFDGISP